MISRIPLDHPLRRMFAGLTEHAFMAELGVADVRIIDYVSELLTRFVHTDEVYLVRKDTGYPMRNLAEMAAAAEREDLNRDQRREVFRHIGDFSLFWTGVYPECLSSTHRQEEFILDSYRETGKRSYLLASTYTYTDDQKREAPVLRTLSESFDTCIEGLRHVRSTLDRQGG